MDVRESEATPRRTDGGGAEVERDSSSHARVNAPARLVFEAWTKAELFRGGGYQNRMG